MEVKVLKNILGANEQLARKNQELLDKNGVFAVNIMSSPGSGKTSLILKTIRELKGKARIGVIEGDIASSVDAETVAREQVPVIQINTGGGCHLDANMIGNAMSNLPLHAMDILFIENVGNLICPADFALGEHTRVIIASVPEGDDKPIKYPIIFHDADLVLLNKNDLLPYVKFDLAAFYESVRNINEKLRIIPISCTTGEGIGEWLDWLTNQKQACKKTPPVHSPKRHDDHDC
jgi:hydrogenase nickel incorporation protein HypB